MKRKLGVALAMLLAALLALSTFSVLADDMLIEQNDGEPVTFEFDAPGADKGVVEEPSFDLSAAADGKTVNLAIDGETVNLAADVEPLYIDLPDSIEANAANDFPGKIVNGELVSYNGTDTDVVLPDIVSRIGKNAFLNNKTLVSVTMSERLEAIGESAFAGCINLKTVQLNEVLKTIGAKAFKDCSKLENIDFPAALETISESAFAGCINLKTVQLNEALKAIDAKAFKGCSKLENIDFPAALETIGQSAFADCDALSVITISEAVKTIGSNAFFGCDGITEVHLLGPVKPRSHGEIDSNDDEGYDSGIFAQCGSLSSAELNGAYVPSAMFSDCVKLSSLSLGDSIISIESNAFSSCSGLAQLTLTSGMKSIGNEAFRGCTALAKISLNPGLEIIGDGAFRECTSLTAVTVPGSVGSIGDHAFRDCSKLADLKLEDGVSVIGNYAFCSDRFLSSVVLPKSVGSIGRAAFYDCARLGNITVYSLNMRIGTNALENISASSNITAYCISTTAEWCQKKGLSLAKTLHKEITLPAVDATCVSTGLTEGAKCVLCNTVTKQQKKLKALGHDKVRDKAVKPTYTTPGLTKGWHCKRCDKALKQKVIPKLEPTAITLKKETVTLKVGKTLALKATLTPEDKSSTQVPLYWSSDNVTVATVTQEGVVNAIAKGTATITVLTPNGLSATCKVTVEDPVSEYVPTAITLNKEAATLEVGKTLTLNAELKPKDDRSKKVPLFWYSDNVTVASVTQEGVVNAIGKGTATITVMTYSGLSATCKVTVKEPVTEYVPTAITLNKEAVTLKVGKTLTLKATLTPKDKRSKKVPLYWYSDNVTVATVTQEGVMNAIAKGTAIITVLTPNGLSATCKVTVEDPVSEYVPTAITLNKEAATLKVGKTLKLKATLTPKDDRSKKVKLFWYSDNVTVAAVTQEGVVNAIAKGTATITVMTYSGLTATCKITVNKPVSEYVPTAINLNKEAATLRVGKTLNLKATLTPKDIRSKNVPLYWYSDNVTVAKVTQKGVVKAIGRGTATITVLTPNGLSATCKITVVNAESLFDTVQSAIE